MQDQDLKVVGGRDAHAVSKAGTEAPTGQFAPLSRAQMLADCTIEVTPRGLAKTPLAGHLAPGTRVFLAHIDGTDFADMLAANRAILAQGFTPVPHLPARSFADQAEVTQMIKAYHADGARSFLVIAGGRTEPKGALTQAMDIMPCLAGLELDHLYVAGHPEGSRDIDPLGGEARAMQALIDKQSAILALGAKGAIVTQFAFDAAPVLAYADRLRAAGIDMPLHIGLAGPARLQSLIKYGITCGVGASLKILQKRARDVTNLLRVNTPDGVLEALMAGNDAGISGARVQGLHMFPLGGIEAASDWMRATYEKAEVRHKTFAQR